MSRFVCFLLSFCVLGFTICSSSAWNVNIPSNIRALKDSCLVIPCSFDYHQNPPKNPERVVWYQYDYNGYPLVYDNWYPEHVIDIFKRKTSVLNSTKDKTCSLEISLVTWSHHRQKIYPWVDPENVGRWAYRFFDTTVTIDVAGRAEKPKIKFSGEIKVGNSVEVECSIDHTCPTKPPTLNLSIPLKEGRVTHKPMSDGTTRTTLRTIMAIERDHQTVNCSVKHTGGLVDTASETLMAKCSFSSLTISPASGEFLEGQSSTITCTASYTCPQLIPTLTWSDSKLQKSTETSKSVRAQWKTVSSAQFTASAADHGKSLTCYAKFSDGKTNGTKEDSIILRVVSVRNNGITIPVVVGIGILVLFGACSIFVLKKHLRSRRNMHDVGQMANNMIRSGNQAVHYQKDAKLNMKENI